MRSANNNQVSICCAAQLSSTPICPNQAILLYESGRPKYCNLLGAACPTGNTCRESINIPGTYVCCSSSNAINCPINYAPATDSTGRTVGRDILCIFRNNHSMILLQIFCTQSNPSVCPGGSSCLQSPSSPNSFICCRSTASEYVCPNNQNALVQPNGQVQVCNGPGSPCSRVSAVT